MSDRTRVVDVSAMVELLVEGNSRHAVDAALHGWALVAPGHFDAEVLSALGRLQRSGHLSDSAAAVRIERLASAPIRREPLATLLTGAWDRRGDTRLTDALYIELAATLGTVVVTTDRRLARTHPDHTLVPDGPS